MRHQSRLSRVVPYSKALGPPAFSETLPPMDEACLEAGSTEKSAPAASTALMTFWVMAPASTVTVMFSRSMGPILVRRVRLTMTVRLRAGTAPPVMPEPPPRGMRANFMSLASFTRAATCSALSGSTTSRGSSMRRSVASVAEATRAEGEERMHSPGRMLRRGGDRLFAEAAFGLVGGPEHGDALADGVGEIMGQGHGFPFEAGVHAVAHGLHVDEGIVGHQEQFFGNGNGQMPHRTRATPRSRRY